MPLIRFLSYDAILLLAESIATALIGTTILTIVSLVFGSRNDFKITASHWSTLGTKCFTLWATATMIVIGAEHYANGSFWFFWASIVLGILLLVFYKADCIRNAEKDYRKATERYWDNPLLAHAALTSSPMVKLWKHETIANTIGIFYILIASLFEPLTKIQWLQSASQAIMWLFTVNTLLSVAIYFVAWMLIARYVFVTVFTLPALLFGSFIAFKKSKNAR